MAVARHGLQRQLQLQTLRILVAIADHGTFARAAEDVNLVPSAVSRRVQELEQLVGQPLLHRSPHAVRFTEAGSLLLNRARRILHEIDGLEADLAGLEEGARGRVRMAASTFALFESLPEVLARFRRQFPGIDVEFQSLSSKRVIAGLYGKTLDLGIFAASRLPPGIDGILYRQDHLAVLVPQTHELAQRAGLTLADVANQALIGPPPGTEIEKVLRDQARRAGLRLNPSMQVASLDAMVLMVQAGLGLCIVPSRVWSRLGPFPRVTRIPLAEPWSLRQLFLGTLPNTPANSPTWRLYHQLSQVAGASNES